MTTKEMVSGIILIVLGALPFLLNIKGFIPDTTKSALSYLIPGGILYQGAIIVIGIFLVYRIRRYRY